MRGALGTDVHDLTVDYAPFVFERPAVHLVVMCSGFETGRCLSQTVTQNVEV